MSNIRIMPALEEIHTRMERVANHAIMHSGVAEKDMLRALRLLGDITASAKEFSESIAPKAPSSSRRFSDIITPVQDCLEALDGVATASRQEKLAAVKFIELCTAVAKANGKNTTPIKNIVAIAAFSGTPRGLIGMKKVKIKIGKRYAVIGEYHANGEDWLTLKTFRGRSTFDAPAVCFVVRPAVKGENGNP